MALIKINRGNTRKTVEHVTKFVQNHVWIIGKNGNIARMLKEVMLQGIMFTRTYLVPITFYLISLRTFLIDLITYISYIFLQKWKHKTDSHSNTAELVTWEEPSLSFGWKIRYPGLGYLWISSVSPCKCRTVPWLGPDHFALNFVQLVMLLSTQYSLRHWMS
jgi:hypothetical protein